MTDNKEKKKKIVMIVAAVLLLVAAVIIFLYFRSQIRATTMRILRIEGEVTLEDDGKPKSIKNNLRLNSGNALSTAVKSLVSIGLDEVKIVTLDERSRAIFNQKGRQLDLELTDGSLFFEVQQPLADDETMDIRTSTMVVGIRGTSGWVSVDGEHEQLIVTDGTVHVIGTNPVTGEVKEIDVKAGQRVTVYLYNDRSVDSIMFVLEEVIERDLPEFLLERLRENPELLEKVCRETGWDKPWILGIREEDMPKVVMDSDETDDKDGLNDPAEALDTVENEPEIPESDEKTEDGVLTKEELAWAHSHIMFIDPGTGILALNDTTLFDPAFYAATNPDVVAKYGTDPDALLWHYLQRGKKEGRPPIALPTPTPTPIPWWLYPQEKSEEPEEDDKPESTPAPTPTPIPNYIGPGSYTTDTNGYITMSDGTRIRYRDGINPPMANYTPGATIDVSGTGLEITDNSITPAVIRNITSMNAFDFQNTPIPTTITKTVNGKTYKAEIVYDPNNQNLVIGTLYEDGVVMTPPAGSNYLNPSTSGVGGGTDLHELIEDFNNSGYNL